MFKTCLDLNDKIDKIKNKSSNRVYDPCRYQLLCILKYNSKSKFKCHKKQTPKFKLWIKILESTKIETKILNLKIKELKFDLNWNREMKVNLNLFFKLNETF